LKYLSYSVFALLVLVGCEKYPSGTIISVSKEEVIELMDTIAIDIDADLMGQYVAWSISDDNCFVAYHHSLHKIDVFNLSDQKFSYSIRLDNQGPHAVVPLGDVVKIKNEFFVISGLYYYRISPDGFVVDKKIYSDLNISKEGYFSSQRGPRMMGYSYFSFDREQGGFFQPIYKYMEDGVLDFSAYFMSFIDYTTWESTYVPVYYPALFLEAHTKSIALGDANMIRTGSSLIFNFPCANEVFEYNTLSKNLKAYTPEILNKEEMMIDIREYGDDMLSQTNAQMLSSRYLPVKYDKKNNVYYRLHKSKVEGRFENGANMFDASFFLIKMDSNFNMLAQYNLGSMFNPKYEVHDGYLYFSPKEVDESAFHSLRIYRMKP
jgi:hypothetical protein